MPCWRCGVPQAVLSAVLLCCRPYCQLDGRLSGLSTCPPGSQVQLLSVCLLPLFSSIAQVDGDAPENQDVKQQLEVRQEPCVGAVGAWSACSLPAARAGAQAAIAPAGSVSPPAAQCDVLPLSMHCCCPWHALPCLQDGEFIQVELVPVHGLLQS